MARSDEAIVTGVARQMRTAFGWVRKHRAALGYLFGAILLAFLVRYLYANWELLLSFRFSFRAGYLLISVILITITVLFPAFLWWRLVVDLSGVRLDWLAAIRLWYTSHISRYLPGGAWSYLSRVYLFQEQGIAVGYIAVGLVMEMVFSLVAQVLVFLVSLPFWTEGGVAFYWALLILPAGVVLLHPAVLRFLLRTVASLQGKSDLVLPGLRFRWLVGIQAGYLASAIVGGTSFFFFVHSLDPLPIRLWPALAGMVNLAHTVGFLAVFAPNGLGVREGTLALLLGSQLSGPLPVIVALASRLWLLAGELLGWALTWLLSRVR